jgi:predicted O-methyltransferase YrrM
MTAATLERIFIDRPMFHRIAETAEGFRTARSALPRKVRDQIAALTGRQNWGISPKFGRYLLDAVKPNMRTLETGAGISTLIFALGGAEHTAVAPWSDEMDEIRNYAATAGIDMSRVKLVAMPSEKYLPSLTNDKLDIVFIDGHHAFPWPILDWYYTADHLDIGGLMMLDDTQLPSINILSAFLKADTPRWQFVQSVERTDIFRKSYASVHDVAWHEQPWTARSAPSPIFQRIMRRLKLAR